MKRCLTCDQTYDDTQSFCANDGSRLVDDRGSSYDPMATIMAPPPSSTGEIKPPQTFADPTPPPQPSPAQWSSPSPPSSSDWRGGSPAPYAQAAPYAPAMPYAPMQAQQNGLAIASLVCGIVSYVLCLGPLAAIPAIILGFMHLNKIKADPTNYGAKGLAIAGMALGGVNLVLLILYVLFILLAAFASR